MITVFIKGTKKDALALSERLAMPLLTLEEYQPASGYNMVKADVFSHYHMKIATDYNKPTTSPAPAGTIVYYTLAKEEDALCDRCGGTAHDMPADRDICPQEY